MNETTFTNQSPLQSFQSPSNERTIPIRMDNGYSASLPRKIKLGQEFPQPRSYENPGILKFYFFHKFISKNLSNNRIWS